MTTIRIIDCDGDVRSANDNDSWLDLGDCLADIHKGLANNDCDGTSWLPWKVVDYDSARDTNGMTVLSVINDVLITVDLDISGDDGSGRTPCNVAADHAVNPVPTKGGKVKRRIK